LELRLGIFAHRLGRTLGRLLLSAGVVVAVPALAADDEAPETSKPRSQVDVLGAVNLSRSTVWDSPRATSAVLRDELRVRPARLSADTLDFEDGVVVQRPSANTAMPSMRGLGDARVLIVVDGIRLNTTTSSSLPSGLSNINLVDPYLLEAVEVVRGPGLASLGSDGLGGTISLRTRRPAAIVGANLEINAGTRLSYSSYDQGFSGSVSGGGRWGRLSAETAFSARHFNDLGGGYRAGTVPLSSFSDGGLYVGASADTGHGTLLLVYQGGRQYDGLRSERSLPDDLYLLTELARDLTYIRYNTSIEIADSSVDVTATAAYHRLSEQAARTQVLLDRVDRLSSRDDVLSVSANVRADLGRGGRLAAGLDGYFDWVSSSAEQATVGGSGIAQSAAQWQRYPTGSAAHSFAIFLVDEIDLEHLFQGEPSARPGRWKALVSGRIGGNFLVVGADDRAAQLFPSFRKSIGQRTDPSLAYSGSLHLRYEFVPGAALSAGFMTGSRPASLDDQARLDAGRPGLLLPSETALLTESAYSGEFGVRLAFARLETSLMYAVNQLVNPISLASTKVGGADCYALIGGRCVDRLLTRRNEGSALLHSVEGSFRLHLFSDLHLLGSISYTSGEVRSTSGPDVREPMWRVPPLMGLGSLQLRRPRSILSLAEVGARAAASQRQLSSQDRLDATVCPLGATLCDGSPWFVMTYVRGSLRLSRQIYLSGTLENLTNETYRVHGSGIPGPGLGAHLTLEGNL
jgi:outer membrane receptor protein involved in Fe transport